MYKLLVVDDEEIVINAVKFIVSKNFDNVEVVDSARNGREAIEKASNLNPDIIFMDIRMPGINGIDAIKEIKERNSRIQFVILSAYEQFEFAKEAVNLGVKEYILKPINRYKLIDTLNVIINELGEKEKKRKKELENIEKLQNILPILESGFIYSILMDKEFGKEVKRYRDLFDLGDDGGYIMIIEFGEGEKAMSLTNKIGSSVKSQKFYPSIRDMLKYRCKCLIGPTMINRIIVFVANKEHEDEYKQRLNAIEMAEDIVKKAKKSTDVEFFIGIGGYSQIEYLHNSYEEALKALRDNSGEHVVHIMDVKEVKDISLDKYNEQCKKLLSSIEVGNTDEALLLLNKIFDSISKLNPINRKSKMIELIVLIYQMSYTMGIPSDIYIDYSSYLQEVINLEEDKIQRWAIKRTKHIIKMVKEYKQNKVSKLIMNAKDYIDKYFSNEITLEEVSKVISISPQYFSRLFKEETGYNFIEYLTNIRIKKSKSLIKNSNKTIKEICYEVGYNDPNYFSRLFKKIVGISPTEYQKDI
ncbi:response regulator [Vallitalea sediminicola]